MRIQGSSGWSVNSLEALKVIGNYLDKQGLISVSHNNLPFTPYHTDQCVDALYYQAGGTDYPDLSIEALERDEYWFLNLQTEAESIVVIDEFQKSIEQLLEKKRLLAG